MLRVTVLERGRLIRSTGRSAERGEEGDDTPSRRRLPAHLYDRLLRVEAAREERGGASVFSWRRNHCLVGPWVGVMQVPGLQVQILPKTDEQETQDAELTDVRNNLMEMLLRGGLGAVRARGVADLSLKRGTLHDQLVDAFLDRALDELSRGLDRGYQSEESNLHALRGRLVLSRQVARNSAHRHRFFCRHDVLSEATPLSIRLKQACRVLAARSMPVSVQVKCQQALTFLDDVPDLPAGAPVPDPLFNRQNERFEDIHAFVRMVLEGQAPDAQAGGVETFSLLFDMDKVFERYVASFLLRQVVPRLPGVRLFPQAKRHRLSLYRDEQSDPDRGGVLQLAPDLLFTLDAADGPRRLIVDTKWKRLTPNRAARPTNDDLYQLYAYLRRYDCDRAFFLYPRTEGVSARDLSALAGDSEERVGSIGVRFVDVRERLWTAPGRASLGQQLEAIVREGLGLDPLTQPAAHVAESAP